MPAVAHVDILSRAISAYVFVLEEGSPLDFRTVIDRLDRARFQTWVYRYRSGPRLMPTARMLAGLVTAPRCGSPCRHIQTIPAGRNRS